MFDGAIIMHRFTIFLIAIFSISTWASGQNNAPNPVSTRVDNSLTLSISCIASKDVMAKDLYGNWVLELKSITEPPSLISTRLSFKQNPEFSESLAGQFSLQSKTVEVFGDIEEGALELEESDNGKDISALWMGRIAEGSCGQAITGTRRMLATQTTQQFVLRRTGW
jgi:hypothetical protein